MTSWAKKRLDEVADLCLGKMLDAAKNRGEELPYLANVNVRWGTFDLDDLRLMRFEPGERERYGLRLGDIVMCEGGEPGRCAIWKEAVPGMMIQKALHRIRAHDGVDQRFLYYFFLHLGMTDGFSHLFTGATIRHLPGQSLAKLLVALPTLNVQRLVADRLSALDDLIDNNRRRIKLLEDSVRLLFNEWFTRNNLPPGLQAVKGEVPRHISIADLCEDVKVQVLPEELNADVPYLGLEHLPRRSITLCEWGAAADVSSTKLRYEAGDIVFGKIRPYFHKVGIALTDGVCSSDAIVMRSKAPHWHPLLVALVSTDEFIAATAQGMKEGSKMPRADWKQMKAYKVCVPSQRALATFNAVVDPVLQQVKTLALQSRKLRTARDLLLPRLMSGQLAV